MNIKGSCLSIILCTLAFRASASSSEGAVDPAANNSSDNGEGEEEEEEGIQFRHFVAYNSTQTCSSDTHALPFNNQIRGVNIGGWMVLEPWITPSLFYQFLGGDETNTAMDHYSFCQVLGPEEGNRQLKRHWETWVTQNIIKELAESGAVNSLRVPVGDFMFEPYGPYIGCTDGALDYLDTLLDWAHGYGLSVLLDVHTQKDSQNGFDNSGLTMGFQWTSRISNYPRGLTTFQHWPIRAANWIGDFDSEAVNYTSINHDNIAHSLRVIEHLVDRYSGHPAVLGVEPVNEPWELTPIKWLKKFYWDAYLIVKRRAPYWKFIMHDSFRFTPEVSCSTLYLLYVHQHVSYDLMRSSVQITKTWGGFMKGCPDRALDTHIYQAWMDVSISNVICHFLRHTL